MGRKRNRWLKETDVRRLCEQGMTDAEIAAALGARRATVTTYRLRHGIPINAVPVKHKLAGEVVAKLNAKGWSDRRIAESLGVGRDLVRVTRGRYGIPPVPPASAPRDFTLSRLRELARRKLTDGEIGTILGRTANAIRHYRLRNDIKKRKGRTK